MFLASVLIRSLPLSASCHARAVPDAGIGGCLQSLVFNAAPQGVAEAIA